MGDPRKTTRHDTVAHATTRQDSVAPAALPGRQVGPYQLLGILGEGRTGTVFKARRPGIDRDFAVKVFAPAHDADAEARLLREARVASRLAHPGLARVLEVDRHEGRLYLVMEHVPGPTLREQVEKGGPMPSGEAALLAAEVADALDAAHRAGTIHRDVRPENVVLDDRTGRPRLIDFGLAREVNTTFALTRSGQGLGTPGAAAPEQLAGEEVDARADVYGVGVTLYELLTGARPFERDGDAAADVAARVLREAPEPPSRLVPGVDRRVEAECLRAMARAREDRHQDAAALAAALRAAVVAPPAETARRLGGVAALATAAALVAAALAGLGSALADARGAAAARRAARERARSRLAAAEAQARAAEDALARARAGLDAAARRRAALLAARDADAEALRRARAAALQAGELAAAPAPTAGEAVAALVRWLERAQDPAALRLRCDLLLDTDRHEEALAVARRLPRGSLDATALEVRCLLELGRKEEARPLVSLLAREAPAGTHPHRFVRVLVEGTGALRDLPPDSEAHLLLGAGQVLEAEGLQRQDPRLLEEAARIQEGVVARAPWSVDALYARSSAHYHLWLLTKEPALVPRFLEDLVRARGLEPRSIFWTYVGKAHVMLDRGEEALPELEVAVQLADLRREPPPARGVARAWLGAARALVGEPEEALEAWLEALQLAPDAPNTYDFLPWVDRLRPEQRARLLGAVPPARRADVERALAGRG